MRHGDDRTLRFFGLLLPAITAVAACSWLCICAPWLDDYAYRYTVPASGSEAYWACGGEPITSAAMALDTVADHFRYINGRLPNLLFILLQTLPRAVTAVLCGLCWGGLLLAMLRGCRFRSDRLSLSFIATATALLILAFPWYDNFQSLAYQLNYVPASLLFIVTAAMSRRCGSLSHTGMAWASAAAFFTGWWHEGFAPPLLAAMAVMYLLYPARRRQLILPAVALIVAIALGWASGTADRAGMAVTGIDYSLYIYLATRIISELWPLWLAMAAVAAYSLSRRDDRRELLRESLPWLAGALVAVLQALVIMRRDRAMWPADLCSVIVILLVVSAISRRSRPSRGSIVAASVATLLYAGWWGVVIAWQWRLSDRHRACDAAMTQAAMRGNSVVFTDIEYDNIPWYVALMTNDRLYLELVNQKIYSSGFRLPTMFFTPMPAALEHVPINSWPGVAGDNDLRGCWPWVVSTTPPGVQLPDDGDGVYHKCEITLHAGNFRPSATPVDRALHAVKEALGHRDDSVTLDAVSRRVMLDGDTLYVYHLPPLPRTIINRDIVAVDITPTQ